MVEAATDAAERVFLVVVDDSAEMKVALRYACRRARKTGGRVALLYAIEPQDHQHWMAVGDLMREEARAEAEQVLQKLAAKVNDWTGTMPVLYVREGARGDQLFKLIEEEPSISILVLGANPGPKGPGPLVSLVAGKMAGKLRVPVTIVPGDLSYEDVDKIS
jgi:nucleotide-binding universal stress UspA family protein